MRTILTMVSGEAALEAGEVQAALDEEQEQAAMEAGEPEQDEGGEVYGSDGGGNQAQ